MGALSGVPSRRFGIPGRRARASWTPPPPLHTLAHLREPGTPPLGPARTKERQSMFGKLIKKVFGTKHERQMKKLQPIVDRTPWIAELRGKGLMQAIETVEPA